MAFALRSRVPVKSQTVKSQAPACKARRPLVCRAVLNLEPPKHTPEPAKRDVSVKATGADGEALPLPDQPEQSQRVSLTPSLLDAIVENTVKVPYNAYNSALQAHPLTTKACTSMVGFILGDLIAQVRYSVMILLQGSQFAHHVDVQRPAFRQFRQQQQQHMDVACPT